MEWKTCHSQIKKLITKEKKLLAFVSPLVIWILTILSIPLSLRGENPFSIVAVHIGPSLPSYLEIALDQARLFNPSCPIILIGNEEALKNFESHSNITLVSCESLPLTKEHQIFQKQTKFDSKILEGYLRYTSERFLYLYDYMVAYQEKNIFHLENDVLLYVDLQRLLPIFEACYQGIATTFESQTKCVPGFVFIRNQKSMQKLAYHFAIYAPKAMVDMKLIGLFWKEHNKEIDCLPMMMEEYFFDHTPSSFENTLLKKKLHHSKHINQFKSIFDGAAIGVYLDGIDPTKGNFPPGYLMKTLFDASLMTYHWFIDEKNRKIPYAKYKDQVIRINNLHIASKRLEQFISLPLTTQVSNELLNRPERG